VALGEFDETAARGESTASAAARVRGARVVQLARQQSLNARLSDAQVERWCKPDPEGRAVLELSMQRLGFSARSRVRVLKVARTIADLDGAATVSARHVTQAVMLRCFDRTIRDGTAPVLPRLASLAEATSPSAPCDPPPA